MKSFTKIMAFICIFVCYVGCGGNNFSGSETVIIKENRQPVIENANIPNLNKDIKNEKFVWLSETGNKFHSKSNCGNMNLLKAKKVTLEQAVNSEYEACENCYR